MTNPVSRRDFLKLSLLTLGVSAFQVLPAVPYPDDFDCNPVGLARVTAEVINIYADIKFSSKKTGTYKRDQLILLLKEISSSQGPAHNRRWYQTLEGYVHSGYLQRVTPRLNQPVTEIPGSGQLGEITITSFRSMYPSRTLGWLPRYQLYFGSIHWITGIEEGPYKPQPWYQITDDLLRVKHYVPAAYVRLISAHELKPISPHIPPQDKRIQVSVDNQQLTAFEKDRPVFHAKVSTGMKPVGEIPDDQIPTDTPLGHFRIGNKMPSRHMGDGALSSLPGDYEYLGVPWVCYFHETGTAFHGTFWHDNFGLRMSHGCVNLRTEDAKWIYLWTLPTVAPGEWYRIENGTVVDII